MPNRRRTILHLFNDLSPSRNEILPIHPREIIIGGQVTFRSLESGNLLNEDLRPFLDGGCSRPLAGYPISARPSCIYACLFSREMRLVTKAPRVVRLARQREREREREYRNKRRRRRGIAKRNNPIRREVVALALEGSKKVPD